MSIDYSLKLANSIIDENLIKKVLKDMSIDALKTGDLELGFYFYKFDPNIKMCISFINDLDYPEGHPANNSETMFLANDFYCNNTLTYSFEKKWMDDEKIDIDSQYNIMLSSVMELARISNKEALFIGPGGEDVFFYKNGTFFFESESYDEFMSGPEKAILEKYSCVEFDGKPL